MSKEKNYKFYTDIHKFWSELQTIDKLLYVPHECVSWQTKGIQYVNNILTENGDFLSHTEISEKFGVRWHFL